MAKIRDRAPKKPRLMETPEREENSSLLVAEGPEESPNFPSRPRQLWGTPLVSDGYVEASKRVEPLQTSEGNEEPSLLVVPESLINTPERERNSFRLVPEGHEGVPKTPSQHCPRTTLVSNELVEASMRGQSSQANERTGEPSIWELEEISNDSSDLYGETSLWDLEEISDDWSDLSFLELEETSDEMSARDQFLHRRKVFAQHLEYYQGEHAKGNLPKNRPDLWAMKAMRVNEQSSDFDELGDVPGAEVGDMFDFRSEIFVVGLHRQLQNGIAAIMHEGERVACSVVVSGDYPDDVDGGKIIEYTGQGGRNYKGIIDRVQVEDQKSKRGNKALINSCKIQTPVRVIRGYAGKSNWNKIYSYDGLYKVTNYKLQKGIHGYLVYKFTLEQLPNQPPLNIEKMQLMSSKFNRRK